MKNFETTIAVRWADCDINRHVRHSAYYDYGAHARIRFFMEKGYDAPAFQKLHIGPVLFKEECSFIREIHLEDQIRVNFLKEQVSEDGSRQTLHHEIFNQDGVKSAHITIKGAWIDLNARKLTVPPIGLAKAVQGLPNGEAYAYKKG